MKIQLKSPFKASPRQVVTYLLGVALFSISFLVFLNSAVSFVITDRIGQKDKVGDAVGTLGFADELLALIACPFWGLLSDRLGVRTVCMFGYGIIAISLFLFVQARSVYPQLLLARLLFSVGGAASSTMVTAILPTMTMRTAHSGKNAAMSSNSSPGNGYESFPPAPSDVTESPSSFNADQDSRSATSQIAGFVGMFTGLGALVALGLFLPLPARFQLYGASPAEAVSDSFYVVGSVAVLVSVFCGLGLRNLPGEENKGWNLLINRRDESNKQSTSSSRQQVISYSRLFLEALKLGFTDSAVGLGYLGGFVARASSVGISLFIPLFVNHYFVSSGLCSDNGTEAPADIKEQCRRAYTVAAALTGVSQTVALVCAPVFGYVDGKFRRFNISLLIATVAGVVGYGVLARKKNPDPSNKDGGPAIFAIMALLGISQIGAIVCSLSLLGRGVQSGAGYVDKPSPVLDIEEVNSSRRAEDVTGEAETSALLPSHARSTSTPPSPRSHLKGSIAGLYSLAGGAGILLLTKLGGYLFDRLSPGAPFYMLAIFNAVLLLVVLTHGIITEARTPQNHIFI